jgi:quinol monooxygenase YgiN
MVHAALRMVIHPDKRWDALEVLTSMIERIRDKPGCISCRVYQDVQQDEALLFEEMWSTEEDLMLHLRSEEYRNVLLVVEMSKEPPEIGFHSISGSTGIETIKKARNGIRPI